MKRYFVLFVFASLTLMNLNTSCVKDSENTEVTDTSFIVKNYEPDIVINKDDTVCFDINQDGKYDFKAYQHKYSSGENPIFESMDSLCYLSLGTENPPFSFPKINRIYEGNIINDNLTWDFYIPWTITESDTLNGTTFLALKLLDFGGDNYFGWIKPMIKDVGLHSFSLYIDKTGYCKIKNQSIKAGQESNAE